MKSKLLKRMTAIVLTVVSIFTMFSATLSVSAAVISTDDQASVAASLDTSSGQWVTVKIEKDGEDNWNGSGWGNGRYLLNGVRMHCLIPSSYGPVDSTGTVTVKFEECGKTGWWQSLRKAMYYYNRDKLDDKIYSLLESVWEEKSPKNRALMFHYAAAYLYSHTGRGEGIDWSYGTASNDQKSIIKQLAEYIDNQPAPPSNYICYIVTPNDDTRQVMLWESYNELTIEKIDSETGKRLSGAKFNFYYTGKGDGCYGSRLSRGVYTTGSDGTVTIKDVPPGSYELVEETAPDGYQKSDKPLSIRVETSQTSKVKKTYKFENTPKPKEQGVMKIYKKSANEELTNNNSCYSLEGAKFQIFTDKACTVPAKNSSDSNMYITTDKNGIGYYGDSTRNVTASLIESYYVKEIEAPKGYSLNNGVFQFKKTDETSDNGYPIYSFTCEDLPQNDPVEILLRKTDKNGKGLPDAEFTIKYYSGFYSSENELNGVEAERTWIFKTDEDGYAIYDESYKISGDEFYTTKLGTPIILLGTITIQETKAPVGYIIDDSIFIRQITSSDSTTDIVKTYNAPEIPNEHIPYQGKIELTKTDEETSKALAGAVYGVYNSNTTDKDGNLLTSSKLDTLTTGSSGKAISKAFDNGTYYMQEITPPTGYVRDKTVYPVTINADSENFVVKVTRTDKPITVEISKTDITGQKEVPGAKLKVTNSENTVVDSWISGTTPHIIKRLPAGEYTLTEEIAPNGYVTASSIKFTVKDDGSVNKVVMKDDTTKYEFSKVDENNNLIKDVTLQVLDSTKSNVIDEWVTDGKTNHQIIGKLVVGQTYYLHEVEAPNQYKLASDKKFTVKDTAELQTVTMVNIFKKGTVTLYKQDSKGNALAGSEWALFKADGTAVTVTQTGTGIYFAAPSGKSTNLVTDKNGKLVISNLDLGSYYFEETKSPTSHMPYSKKLEFIISADSETVLNPKVTAKNDKIVLYETGGNGTNTIFFAGFSMLAISLAVIAVYMLKTKKHSRK